MLLCLLVSLASYADNKQFVYLKTSETNLRVGPSMDYAIRWVIKSKFEPVLKLAKFEEWVKVRDIDGSEGWVRDGLVSHTLSGAIVVGTKPVVMYSSAKISSKKMLRLEPKVRVRVKKCNDEGWCKVSIEKLVGWVQKEYLWGV
jgi:SH3-like domain-containing protein